MPVTIQRDKTATRAALIGAVGIIIGRDGFGALGINAVAREAGVDKVLIYRYFENIEGLLAAYGEQGDFWWSVEDVLTDADKSPTGDFAGWLTQVFRHHIEFLRHHPVTLEILAWEMSDRNPLTIALEEVREARGLELMKHLADRFDFDQAVALRHIGPMMALFGAASNYLVTRARGIRTFNGIDVQSDLGWAQIYETVEAMLRAFIQSIEKESRA
ncbi:MAG: TetR/AcrR family transcriptional regulator [Alphaproteobacteria bacterium]